MTPTQRHECRHFTSVWVVYQSDMRKRNERIAYLQKGAAYGSRGCRRSSRSILHGRLWLGLGLGLSFLLGRINVKVF